MNKRQWGNNKMNNMTKSKKLSLQQVQKITERQYQKAMEHLQKVNFNELNKKTYTEPLDPQCTFQPHIHSQKRRVLLKGNAKNISLFATDHAPKTQQRLIQWGIQANRKKLQNILTAVVQVESKKDEGLKKIQKPIYSKPQKTFSKIEQSQMVQIIKSKMLPTSSLGPKKRSQTTFMSSSNVKSKSSLLSRLLQ